jgi:uncharacterized protein (TIGR02186 family)
VIRLALVLLAFLSAPFAALGEEVVAGLSQNRISINANFDGSEILVFGAVKRTEPVGDVPPLEVIITVSGPRRPVMVRRKEKLALIWVNRDAVEVDAAPSFYAVATSGKLRNILTDTEDLRHRISPERAVRSVGAPVTITDASKFTDALIRIKTEEGFYTLLEDRVQVREETLFDASIALPANLVEGNYTTRIFLTRGGRVINRYETVIYVQKVGLERFLYNLAHEQPLAYGALSLVIAIAAGWGASALFRYIRS